MSTLRRALSRASQEEFPEELEVDQVHRVQTNTLHQVPSADYAEATAVEAYNGFDFTESPSSEDQQLEEAMRASLRTGNITQYEQAQQGNINSTDFESSPPPTHYLDSDEQLARELNAQINAPRQRVPDHVLEMYDEQNRVLRQKTYQGAYLNDRRNIKPTFTYLMVFLCSITMGLELLVNNTREGEYLEDFTTNPLLGPSTDTLLFLGAKRSDLIVNNQEWWRLIMPMFLHGGILHLFFNMLFLVSFGSGLEKEFGHLRVAYIYLFSGLFGVLMSAIFNPTIPSVGASGACYGLIGAAWADFGLNFSYYKENGNWVGWFIQLLLGTSVNLCLGLVPSLDNFAHVGGFIAGLFTGLTVLTLPRYDYFEQIKPDKCYQIILKSIAIFIVPVGIIVALIVLYVGIDATAYCPWCESLNCVDTPWWSCDAVCEEGFTISLHNSGELNGTATITCPRDEEEVNVQPPLPEDLQTDESVQLQFCRDNCLD
eukprot:augustus_masked-scaffold_1-processed-gene-31.59-mRNA-1 protein AED:0.16 eAED:0.19 QI:0/-1/0/1/-1/1/1/0/484